MLGDWCSRSGAGTIGAVPLGRTWRPASVTAGPIRRGTVTSRRPGRYNNAVSVVAGAVVFAGAVGLTADHVEAFVELHVDLEAVVERDLDLVVAVLVAHLGVRDPATASVGKRGPEARARASPVIGGSLSSPP